MAVSRSHRLASFVPPRKLPVWAAVFASFGFVARNLGQLARAVFLPLLMMLFLWLLAIWLASPWLPTDSRQKPEFTAQIVKWAIDQIPILFAASIAVTWHRFVLLGEKIAWEHPRFDRAVWTYALLTVMLGLVSALSIVIAFAFVFFVLPRLSLVLPAVALGEKPHWDVAWEATRSNTLRLAAASLLCILLPAVPFGIILLGSGVKPSELGPGGRVAMAVVGQFLAIIAVTFLSLSYRHFVQRRQLNGDPAT